MPSNQQPGSSIITIPAQVEYVALQVLQLLKASERVRNSLLYDSNAEEDAGPAGSFSLTIH